ncbi:MAG TPA: hypothetical protein VF502_09250, partial [Stellaceae bacterium]
MFIAALLDAFPHLEAGVRGSIDTMLRGRVECRLFRDRDRALAGKRFAAEEIAHRMSDADRVFAAGGALEAVLKAKQAGKLRHIGFTGHKSPQFHRHMLEVAAQHKFVFDTVQMPLRPGARRAPRQNGEARRHRKIRALQDDAVL